MEGNETQDATRLGMWCDGHGYQSEILDQCKKTCGTCDAIANSKDHPHYEWKVWDESHKNCAWILEGNARQDKQRCSTWCDPRKTAIYKGAWCIETCQKCQNLPATSAPSAAPSTSRPTPNTNDVGEAEEAGGEAEEVGGEAGEADESTDSPSDVPSTSPSSVPTGSMAPSKCPSEKEVPSGKTKKPKKEKKTPNPTISNKPTSMPSQMPSSLPSVSMSPTKSKKRGKKNGSDDSVPLVSQAEGAGVIDNTDNNGIAYMIAPIAFVVLIALGLGFMIHRRAKRRRYSDEDASNSNGSSLRSKMWKGDDSDDDDERVSFPVTSNSMNNQFEVDQNKVI